MTAGLKLEEPPLDPLRAALEDALAMVRIARGDCEVAEAALLVALRRATGARERLEVACGLVEQVAKEIGRK